MLILYSTNNCGQARENCDKKLHKETTTNILTGEIHENKVEDKDSHNMSWKEKGFQDALDICPR